MKRYQTILSELILFQEEDLRLLYFHVGQEWIMQHVKGWSMWGDQVWEGWYTSQFEKVTRSFCDSVRVGVDLKPYLVHPVTGKRIKDLDVLRQCYERYVYLNIMLKQANPAIMELCSKSKANG